MRRGFVALLSALTLFTLTTAMRPATAVADTGTMSSAPARYSPVTDGTVNAIAASRDSIYLGGDFDKVGHRAGLTAGFSGYGLIEMTADFTGYRDVAAVDAIVEDGSYGWYVGGSFRNVNGIARHGLVWMHGPYGAIDPVFRSDTDGTVLTLAIAGGKLYVGGTFTSIDGQPRAHLAALALTTGQPLDWNPGLDGDVRTLTASSSTIYAGGDFSTAGGAGRSRLAAFDIATGAMQPWNPNADGAVHTLAVRNGVVYAGGDFTTIGVTPRNHIAALGSVSGAVNVWNPAPTERSGRSP